MAQLHGLLISRPYGVLRHVPLQFHHASGKNTRLRVVEDSSPFQLRRVTPTLQLVAQLEWRQLCATHENLRHLFVNLSRPRHQRRGDRRVYKLRIPREDTQQSTLLHFLDTHSPTQSRTHLECNETTAIRSTASFFISISNCFAVAHRAGASFES